MTLPVIDLVSAKIDQLKVHLRIVDREIISATDSAGRIVAESIHAFRDSPATDVSAMDGYAVRCSDINQSSLPVTGTATAGSAPMSLKPRSAIRVFTGGPVPVEAECVVRREDCLETETHVTIQVPMDSVALGQNIRRQGENAKVGDIVIPGGSLLTASAFAGAMTFLAKDTIEVFRRVRVHVLNTGDELIEFGRPIEPWQIRDSNGPFLETSLNSMSWVQTHRAMVCDHRAQTEQAICEALEQCDVLLLTGGVSMGDTDYVPDSIRAVGGQVVFHRIPIRPGRPMLGAYGPGGQLILGLPGNPLSVAVTFRRYSLDLIRHVAGFKHAQKVPNLQLDTSDTSSIELTWFRLAALQTNGNLALVPSRGSGDTASLIQSDGFVEIPPNCQSAGIRKFYSWSSF